MQPWFDTSATRRAEHKRYLNHATDQVYTIVTIVNGTIEVRLHYSATQDIQPLFPFAENQLKPPTRELRRAHDRADQMQRDLNHATDQLRCLEARADTPNNTSNSDSRQSALAGACAALQERAAHLERSLSSETRVKLDLLSALGDAKRQLTIQEGLISRQEKEIEELKAQMLAVMPTEYVTAVNKSVSGLRLQSSPLDPNASVYTPKQLCSDA
ncbi:macoilin family domain-containing protein [Phthorimaea operculella]|nr:macoilin family domain-containing protein [Phthorimaea operculella]